MATPNLPRPRRQTGRSFLMGLVDTPAGKESVSRAPRGMIRQDLRNVLRHARKDSPRGKAHRRAFKGL